MGSTPDTKYSWPTPSVSRCCFTPNAGPRRAARVRAARHVRRALRRDRSHRKPLGGHGSSPAAHAAGCTEQPRFRSAVLVLRMVVVTTGSSRATAGTPRAIAPVVSPFPPRLLAPGTGVKSARGAAMAGRDRRGDRDLRARPRRLRAGRQPEGAPGWAGLIIAPNIAGLIIFLGNVSRAAINPARAFGPVFADWTLKVPTRWDALGVYILADAIGALAAAWVYPTGRQESPAAKA